MIYNLLLVLASLNVFILYITRTISIIPLPGHPLIQMGIALVLLMGAILRAPMTKKHLDVHLVLLTGFFLIALFFSFLFFHRVGSDGREYYIQLRSLVLDRDVDFNNDYAIFPGRGTASIYAIGAALLWSPFYIAAHLFLTVLGSASPFTNVSNGITPGHQAAVSFAAFFYGAFSLFLIYDVAKNYFSKTIALISVLIVTAASFAAWYWVFEYYMPHTISLFATTLFLYLWHRWRKQPNSLRQWAALGASAGLMAMGRWQDVAFGLVLAIDELPLYFRYLRRRNWDPFWHVLKNHLVFAAAALLVFLPQLLFWKLTRGSFLPPAEQHQVHWSRTDLEQVLWSYNHGLLTWTPVILFSLIGLLLFLKRETQLTLLLVMCFLAELYINSTVANWWAGSGFGARRFLSSLLIFVIGFAELLRILIRRPMLAVMSLCLPLAIFNIGLMIRVGNGQLPSGQNIPPNQLIGDTIDAIRHETGISSTFPASTLFGLYHGVAPGRFDDLEGMQRQTSWKLDLGTERDYELLGYGWSDPEIKSDGTTFRWSNDQSSSLLVPLAGPAEYDLSVRATPLRYPGAPSKQTIAVSVNDEFITNVALSDDAGEYHVVIAPDYWHAGINEIRFTYGYTAVPKDLKLSTDRRRLAVLFDWISGTRIRH